MPLACRCATRWGVGAVCQTRIYATSRETKSLRSMELTFTTNGTDTTGVVGDLATVITRFASCAAAPE